MSDHTRTLLKWLRIVWTMSFAVLTALLAPLWGRSYRFLDDELWYVNSNNRGWYFDSVKGGLTFVGTTHNPANPGEWRKYGAWEPGPLGFEQFVTSRSYSFRVPYWFVCVCSAGCASVPWLALQFSLRTLLIVITLTALGLGLLVYL